MERIGRGTVAWRRRRGYPRGMLAGTWPGRRWRGPARGLRRHISMGKPRPRDLPPSRRPGGRAEATSGRARGPATDPSRIPAASEISVKMQQIADQIDHLPIELAKA